MDLNTIVEQRPADGSSLAAWQPGDAWLAGGTALFAEPHPELRRLIDLTALGWPALTVEHGKHLEIAATCTLSALAELARPDPAWLAFGLLRQCCEALLGSFKVQNMATVGGNLCTALPAGPMSALASALDGVCSIWSADGVREVAAADFVLDVESTILAPGELLRSITLPASALSCHAAFRQFSLTPLGRSAVLVIGRRSSVDDTMTITVTAATRRPVVLRFESLPSGPEVTDALHQAIPATDYYDDVHGDPRWRRHLTHRLVAEIHGELSGPA